MGHCQQFLSVRRSTRAEESPDVDPRGVGPVILSACLVDGGSLMSKGNQKDGFSPCRLDQLFASLPIYRLYVRTT